MFVIKSSDKKVVKAVEQSAQNNLDQVYQNIKNFVKDKFEDNGWVNEYCSGLYKVNDLNRAIWGAFEENLDWQLEDFNSGFNTALTPNDFKKFIKKAVAEFVKEDLVNFNSITPEQREMIKDATLEDMREPEADCMANLVMDDNYKSCWQIYSNYLAQKLGSITDDY